MYKKPVVESVDLQFEKPMCLAQESGQMDPGFAPARGKTKVGSLGPSY